MTNQQILEKAIQKAIDAGWLKPTKKPIKSVVVQLEDGDCYIQFWRGMNDMAWSETWDSYHELIFNHNFAKALWPGYLGYIPGINDDNNNNVEGYWKLMNAQDHWGQDEGGAAFFKGKLYEYHLQQMVIADDPIKYLGENL
jgi:hypothetical protein